MPGSGGRCPALRGECTSSGCSAARMRARKQARCHQYYQFTPRMLAAAMPRPARALCPRRCSNKPQRHSAAHLPSSAASPRSAAGCTAQMHGTWCTGSRSVSSGRAGSTTCATLVGSTAASRLAAAAAAGCLPGQAGCRHGVNSTGAHSDAVCQAAIIVLNRLQVSRDAQ